LSLVRRFSKKIWRAASSSSRACSQGGGCRAPNHRAWPLSSTTNSRSRSKSRGGGAKRSAVFGRVARKCVSMLLIVVTVGTQKESADCPVDEFANRPRTMHIYYSPATRVGSDSRQPPACRTTNGLERHARCDKVSGLSASFALVRVSPLAKGFIRKPGKQEAGKSGNWITSQTFSAIAPTGEARRPFSPTF
jgi:hypothetical protein